ncbi:MAG: hypothetical protein HON90_12545 [Halobacteriovoraceae bacterium]|jgi:hypothetical protein|nr:hypothetical protein [Halobacteriovoraceae bacterium]
MFKKVLVLGLIMISQVVVARSLAPNNATVEINVRVLFEKRWTLVCMGPGCGKSQPFWEVILKVEDPSRVLKTINVSENMTRTIGMNEKPDMLVVANNKVHDGELLKLEGVIRYSSISGPSEMARLVRVDRLVSLGSEVLGPMGVYTCENLTYKGLDYLLTINGKNSQVWASKDGILKVLKGKVKVKSAGQKLVSVEIIAPKEVIDWSREADCWKMSTEPNLYFNFKGKSPWVNISKTLYSDPRVACNIPRFRPQRPADLNCIRL